MSKKTKKKTKKKKKERANGVQQKKKPKFDQFHRRLGTQGYLIDTKMSKTPKSIAHLAKECELPVGRVSTHVRDLTKKGFFKKDKDGKYSIR